MTAIEAYILAKKIALGAVSGIKNLTFNGNQIIFNFNDGSSAIMVVPLPKDGVDGISIVDVEIDENKHLICTLSDNSTIDAGELPGATTKPGGLVQVKDFNSLKYPGEPGALYITLDTQMVYYWDEKNKLYKPIVTNGIKNDTLTSVDLLTDEIVFDGVNYDFDLPVDDTKMNVYVNGVYLTEDIDYEIDRNTSPNKITFYELWEEFDSCTLTWIKGNVYDSGKVEKVGLPQLDTDITNIFNALTYISSKEISGDPWPSAITLDGSKIKTSDSGILSSEQKKLVKISYIIDDNNKVLGMGIVTTYNDTSDTFTMALTQYSQSGSNIEEVTIVKEEDIDKLFKDVPGMDPNVTIASTDDIDKLFDSTSPINPNITIVSTDDIDKLFS